MSAGLMKARGASAYDREEWQAPTEIGTGAAYFLYQYSSEHLLWRERINELQEIRKLNDDWDGEQSMAPGLDLTDGAIALLKSLQEEGDQPPDRIVAGVNGTIFMEWYTPSGYREIEIESPTTAEARWIPVGSNDTIVSLVRWGL